LTRTADYRTALKGLTDWESFLLANSGLPGPRGNLELAQAAAEEGDLERFEGWLAFTPELAPVNDPHEFLAFCGVVGLGRLAAEGQIDLIGRIRPFASDPRWRMREGVAMALQQVGDRDPGLWLEVAGQWAQGSWLEKRAVVAALAEPRLLKDPQVIPAVLQLFDGITASLLGAKDRKAEDFRVLRQALGYGWSVVVAADPAAGKPRLERWFVVADPDIQWAMRENLKKNRLKRMDPEWVDRWSGPR